MVKEISELEIGGGIGVINIENDLITTDGKTWNATTDIPIKEFLQADVIKFKIIGIPDYYYAYKHAYEITSSSENFPDHIILFNCMDRNYSDMDSTGTLTIFSIHVSGESLDDKGTVKLIMKYIS